MKKKVLKVFSLLTFLFIFAMPLKAQEYKLEIVDKGSEKPIGLNGEKFTKEIIEEDLEKGTFKVKLTFDNTDYTEVFFVVDNSTAMTETIKASVIDSLKNLTDTILEENKNVKIGSIAVNNDTKTITNLSSDATSVKAGLDSIANVEAAGDNHILSGVQQAYDKFTSETINRVVIIVTASKMNAEELAKDKFTAMGNFTNDTINCSPAGCDTDGNTDFITVAINLDTDDDVKEYFGETSAPTAGKIDYTAEADIATTIEENVKNNFVDTLPTAKKDLKIVDNFPSILLDNFTISDVTVSDGTQTTDDNKITWEANPGSEGLVRGKKVTLTYTVTMKEKIDSDYIDKILNLNTNDAPVEISYNYMSGGLPKGHAEFTAECTPKVKITVVNPKTGIINYSIAGLTLIVVAGSTLYLTNKNKQFSTI